MNRKRVFGVVALVMAVPLAQWILILGYEPPQVVDGPAPAAPERTVEVYEGYGAWIDVFDYAPAFRSSGSPPFTPEDMSEMAHLGVRTVYLQAAQRDARSPGLLVDAELVGQLLAAAHGEDMDVVGWYLPRLDDLERDMARLEAISQFEVDGHRFDGVAVDIEWRKGVPDHEERSRRLVELSRRLREANGDDALGAIVLTPVHLEVVNPSFWPGFPWKELAEYYDVWLPMAYWTNRETATGFRDGYTYTTENVQRIRANVEDENVPVHVIGGIGDALTPTDVRRFGLALAVTDAIGWSIYDWMTMSPGLRELPELPDPRPELPEQA